MPLSENLGTCLVAKGGFIEQEHFTKPVPAPAETQV